VTYTLESAEPRCREGYLLTYTGTPGRLGKLFGEPKKTLRFFGRAGHWRTYPWLRAAPAEWIERLHADWIRIEEGERE
jgi:hypothetical protein